MSQIILILLVILLVIVLALLAAVVAGFFYKVPYVPSRKKQIIEMIKAAKITEKDHVADLGCGDGKVLFLAEEMTKGASFTGYEHAPLPLIYHHFLKFIKQSKVQVHAKNFFEEDLSKYNVLLLYLLPDTLEKLYPKLKKELPKGARVLSNVFKMKGQEPTAVITKDGPPKIKPIYIYQF